MAGRARIIFVDDERDLAEALAEYFADLGHESVVATDGIALEAALPADLVVLDLNLPGRSGMDLLRDLDPLREAAVIILTANQDAIDRIIGLESGADDYVLKPVNPRELAARAAAVLARRQGRRRTLVSFETTSADLSAARVLLPDGGTEALSAGDVALIRAFATRPNRVISRDELIRLAPAESVEAFDRAIDSRIARLRRKLRTDSIVTLRGAGYRFDPPFPE
jgi:DNA-binding response OmpR family regulator